MKKKRTKSNQNKHDKAVSGSAKWYERHNYKVNADLPGYKKPKEIGRYIPDLIAKKRKEEIIVEVETKKTNKIDKDQHQAFKDYAKRKKEREFKKRVV